MHCWEERGSQEAMQCQHGSKSTGMCFLLFPASIRNALERLLQEEQLPLEKNDRVKPVISGPSIQIWPRSAVTDSCSDLASR